MKNKLLNLFLVLILSVILIINVLTLLKIKEKDQPALHDSENLYYKELINSLIINQDYLLNNALVYRGKENLAVQPLSEVVDDSCLIFRIFGEACNVCIEFVIGKLKQVFNDFYETDRILFIGSNINERVKDNYFGKPVFSLVEGSMGLPFEEYYTPFLFIAGKDRICKMFFIPEKSIPELTDQYLQEIKTRYFIK